VTYPDPMQPHGTSPAAPDHAGVIMLPPLIFAAFLIAGFALTKLWTTAWRLPHWLRWSAAGIALVALLLAIWGRRTMTRAGTAVRPTSPTTAIVTDGPFRYSRNPLYVSMTMFYIGIALASQLFGALFLLVPFVAVLHWGVIRREERYLERKFGDVYGAYRARTRRWL
jgi:protein-S-isoprenylcysteine O-methyltransferase Ste14